MPYTVPNMTDLHAKVRDLKKDYQSLLDATSEHRFLAGVRPKKKANPERLQSIDFIQLVTNNVNAQKDNYPTYDKDFKKLTSEEKAIFLKQVITGAMLLSLVEITKTYHNEGDVRDRSALGCLILNTFDVNKLSDIPADKVIDSLEALTRYITRVPQGMGLPIEWHAKKSQDVLVKEIQDSIAEYNCAPVCN